MNYAIYMRYFRTGRLIKVQGRMDFYRAKRLARGLNEVRTTELVKFFYGEDD